MKIMKHLSAASNLMAALPALLAFTAVAHSATITSITFNLDKFYTAGSTPPTVPSTTWLTLTVTDDDLNDNQVSLAFSAVGLIGDEYVDSWYLNFGDAVTHESLEGLLVFDFDEEGSSGMTIPVIDPQPIIGSNDQTAPGGLNFDIMLAFANSNSEVRFTNNMTLTYLVTYVPHGDDDKGEFNLNSFDIGSSSGSYGPFTTVAHLNGIPNPNDSSNPTGSAWLYATPIPEPSPGLLGMLAATAWSIFSRRRREDTMV